MDADAWWDRTDPGHALDPPLAEPQARTLADILKDPDVLRSPKPVAPRLAYEGYVTVLAAREKQGKSTLASAAAAWLSGGRPFLGEPTSPGSVLWVAPEEALAHIARRFNDFDANPERIWIRQHMTDPVRCLSQDVKCIAPSLVVIDTLATWAGAAAPESGDARGWTELLLPLVQLARDFNLGLLLLHHANKERGSYRDSTAIGALADVLLQMQTREAGERRIEARARWHMEDFTVRLVGSDDAPRFELTEGELSIDARALLYVKESPGASTREVRDHVTGRAQAIAEALERLQAREAIQNLGSDGRSAWWPGGSEDTVRGTATEPLRNHPGTGTGREGGSGGHPPPGGVPHSGTATHLAAGGTVTDDPTNDLKSNLEKAHERRNA